ncbi:MAG: VIT1/CCC1 transporter family protein [Desulfurococcales archaeon]|nr:VIT1/CCC1 transporter family protein [Desulfurococcales archaeon]
MTRKFLRDLRVVLRANPDVSSIARRMFVTNALDGIVAALGVNIGSFTMNMDPVVHASGMLGGTLAMGVVSGMLGVYVSEKAERLREYRDLERKVASSLKESVYWKAVRLIPIYVALWSGLGIILFPLLATLPFFLVNVLHIDVMAAYYASIVISVAEMAFLGFYLGRISGEGIVKSTLRVLGMGVVALIIAYVLRAVLGISVVG